jgi:hypothetical protein
MYPTHTTLAQATKPLELRVFIAFSANHPQKFFVLADPQLKEEKD